MPPINQRHNRRSMTRKSRESGCWNCGHPHHVSRNCTAPKTARCGRCRKRGYPTHRCPCNQNRHQEVRKTSRIHQKQSREIKSVVEVPKKGMFVPAILMTICKKQIKADVLTGSQESRIGLEVMKLVEKHQRVYPVKKVLKTRSGLELVHTIKVKSGCKTGIEHPIEYVIDPKIPEKEMTLGMQALNTLGYRMLVAGRETIQRRVSKRPGGIVRRVATFKRKKFPEDNNKQDTEDEEMDKMSFLDEEEAQRIREWSY